MPKAQIQFLDDGTPPVVLFSSAGEVDATFAPRFFAAFGQLYGPVPVTPPTTPPTLRAMTQEEIFATWAGGIMQGTEANIQNAERAAAEAAVTPVPIKVTPTT
jgi:hypothetical protein